ncbi:hypothetical protein ACXYRH_04955 [Enterococcus faecalis]|uniref:hypothetical protein n=1 Tax=Enterococcus faecalis TaxID=1351 RepID=UPI001E2B833C|nr:hypothetical protein [Enterococcus faecalis]MDQ4451737.1 hypothetical protein [Enterococcus faecalis]WCG24225.1 hypothetical protein PML91_09120 [Enterococcus faecalis]
MGVKIDEINLAKLSEDYFFRADYDYFEFNREIKRYRTEPLKDLLTFLETGKPIVPDDYSDNSKNIHLVVKNISNGRLNDDNVIYITDEKADELKKFRVQSGDFVIAISANTGASMYFTNSPNYNITLSHYLARFRVDESRINPLFLNYYINSTFMQKYFRSTETGKTLKNLSKYYIKEMPVVIIDKVTQDRVVSNIEPIEKKIKNLQSLLTSPKEVINKIFAREFDFDLVTFKQLKKLKVFESSLVNFSNNQDLRNSVKFHWESGEFVMNELSKTSKTRIKDFLSEPIVLGKGITPEDYDESGSKYYVSMATIKNWKFEEDSENSKTVSDEYFESNKANKAIKINDIIMARSGKGTIGKVALIDNKKAEGIFADFTMRIRFENYSAQFAYYYFQTDYFQHLLEMNWKGLGNNLNIFPTQVQELPLLDVEKNRQLDIVNEIKEEVNRQEEIKKEISVNQNKINKIIENAIFKSW